MGEQDPRSLLILNLIIMTSKSLLKARHDENIKSLTQIEREQEKLTAERSGLMNEKKRLDTLLSINADKSKTLKKHAQLLNDENKSINAQTS